MTKRTGRRRTNSKNATPAITKEQAKKLIEVETLKGHQAFKDAYIKLCEEHGLQIVSFPVHTPDGRTITQQTVGDYEP